MAVSRRRLLQMAGGLAAVAGAGAAGSMWSRLRRDPHNALNILPPTPACDGLEETEWQVDGPFYVPNTPLRAVLREPEMAGIPVIVEGRVLSTDCRPVPGAVLDVWSCDENGFYDNDGFRLRGHQFTDAQGVFRFETVKPSDYLDVDLHRTPHIHVKVQSLETFPLTTQLYFPGEFLNEQDAFFSESLVLSVDNPGDRPLRASFDFVVALRPPA